MLRPLQECQITIKRNETLLVALPLMVSRPRSMMSGHAKA